MGIIKYNPVVSKISGKLDGVNFATHYNKNIVRKNMTRPDANTTAQNIQRDYFITCQRIWGNIAPVIKNTFGANLWLPNHTNYNIFIKENIVKIKNDDMPVIASGGTLTVPTIFFTERPAYGNKTYLYFNPADLIGAEKLQVIIIERGVYGQTTKIKTLELDSADTNPQTINGDNDSDQLNYIGYKTNNNFGTADLFSDQVFAFQSGAEMTAPIGSISWWHKSLTGCPALPAEWAECNGQVLNDVDSPFNGQTLPDINNTVKRFIRGGLASGGLQAEGTKPNGLTIGNENSHTHGIDHNHTETGNNASGGNDTKHASHDHTQTGYSSSGGSGKYNPLDTSSSGPSVVADNKTSTATVTTHAVHKHTIGDYTGTSSAGTSHNHGVTGDAETRPLNITMVAIIRIK